MADRRLTPARADLAAAHLKGKIEAPRYAMGEKFCVLQGRTSLRTRPSTDAPQDSELLHGELFTVYDRANGWAWGQSSSDLYVGYVREEALAAPFVPTAKVSALMAPLFQGPDLKTPIRDFLPMNAAVVQIGRQGDYVEIAPHGFVHYRHLLPEMEKDFVAIALRFLGVAYVWGGKTQAGIDCSGLVQTALQAIGKTCPRDSDMMERSLGESVDCNEARRGDLVFWKGHVGVMLDSTLLLHSNAYHMQVAQEPLAEAVARIEKSDGAITAIKRLQ